MDKIPQHLMPKILGRINVSLSYGSYRLEILEGVYMMGGKALMLRDEYSGEAFSVLSVFIDGVKLQEGEYIIKNYSENEEIVKLLMDRGILVPTGKTVDSSYVSMPICTLHIPKDLNRLQKIEE